MGKIYKGWDVASSRKVVLGIKCRGPMARRILSVAPTPKSHFQHHHPLQPGCPTGETRFNRRPPHFHHKLLLCIVVQNQAAGNKRMDPKRSRFLGRCHSGILLA